MKVYLDSCAVIYLIEKKEPWRQRLEQRLAPDIGTLPAIHFSELTRLECRVGPLLKSDDAALAEYEEFFAAPRFSVIEMGRGVFDLATDLRAAHKLKTPDALHLAAALFAACDEFWTNDTRLAKATENRIRLVALHEL